MKTDLNLPFSQEKWGKITIQNTNVSFLLLFPTISRKSKNFFVNFRNIIDDLKKRTFFGIKKWPFWPFFRKMTKVTIFDKKWHFTWHRFWSKKHVFNKTPYVIFKKKIYFYDFLKKTWNHLTPLGTKMAIFGHFWPFSNFPKMNFSSLFFDPSICHFHRVNGSKSLSKNMKKKKKNAKIKKKRLFLGCQKRPKKTTRPWVDLKNTVCNRNSLWKRPFSCFLAIFRFFWKIKKRFFCPKKRQ